MKRIVHRKGAKVAKKIMKGEKGKEKGERSAMEGADTGGRRWKGKGEKREKQISGWQANYSSRDWRWWGNILKIS
ncbi:MAG: hypothetical protein HUU08_10205 [Candidatus Brocadia sp.]|nr:hypothetical protein [Candidatus Brocadia sp.]